MSTFLELCRKAARDSRAFPDNQPTTVTDQIGRIGFVVEAVKEAWTTIQNKRAGWRWMEAELPVTAVTTSGQARYTGSGSFGLTRFASWINRPYAFSIYDQATGKTDEGDLRQIEWDDFRDIYVRGSHTAARPSYYAISPQDELALGPTPDATYVIQGLYRKTPQDLTDGGDIPEMPARFHDLIAYGANILMAQRDEAQFHLGTSAARYSGLMNDLERDQLPRIRITARSFG